MAEQEREPTDNMAAVLEAHRKVLEGMTANELAQLLIASEPHRFPRDAWFHELIVDVLKRKKPESGK